MIKAWSGVCSARIPLLLLPKQGPIDHGQACPEEIEGFARRESGNFMVQFNGPVIGPWSNGGRGSSFHYKKVCFCFFAHQQPTQPYPSHRGSNRFSSLGQEDTLGGNVIKSNLLVPAPWRLLWDKEPPPHTLRWEKEVRLLGIWTQVLGNCFTLKRGEVFHLFVEELSWPNSMANVSYIALSHTLVVWAQAQTKQGSW